MRHRHLFLPFPALLLLSACLAPHTPAGMESAASKASPFIATMAPTFTLLDQEGHKTSLADFKGKWVILYFFGREDTPGCRCGATEFTSMLLQLEKVNAEVLAINDALPDDNLYSRDQYDLEITVLSDTDNQVMSQYKIRNSVNDPITHQTFLIDPTGRIAWHWPTVIADGHVDRINQKIKELQGKP